MTQIYHSTLDMFRNEVHMKTKNYLSKIIDFPYPCPLKNLFKKIQIIRIFKNDLYNHLYLNVESNNSSY